MNKSTVRIGFMGTPDFAVSSLQYLIENEYNIVVVITMPDKPAGRGQQVQPSPIKSYAVRCGLPILQPSNLKDPHFIEELASFNLDLQIVVAFRMLPKIVWAMPRYGTFNLHASLLPQYRGAAPINWAIINGEKITGVTTFMLKEEIDTGDVILQKNVTIEDEDTAGLLHDKLAETGKILVSETVDLILNAINDNTKLPLKPQNNTTPNLHPAPKLNKDICQIDFNQTGNQIHNFVRGLSPYPTAWCPLTLGNEKYDYVKIYKATTIKIQDFTGTTQTLKGHIILPCKDGFIDIVELQIPGKKRMPAKSLLNGLRIN